MIKQVGSCVSAAAPPAAPAQRTALQKHVDFFDRNGDRVTTVPETYSGLRALGMGRVASGLAAVVINTGLGVSTGAPWYFPFTVHNDNIHQAKHDSDSDVYDDQGEFSAAKFEEMFARFDTDGNDALDGEEIDAMIAERRESWLGSVASKAEFGLLLRVSGESELSRERMQAFYDGNLFYDLAGEARPS